VVKTRSGENYKTTIITGGSRGLGRNTAVNLSRRDVDVMFTYHSNLAEAQSLDREAEANGRKAAAFQLDSGISACSMALWFPHPETASLN